MGVKLLGKIKIHEKAKKLGLSSKEVLEQAIVYNDNDMQTKECGDMTGYLHEMNNTEFV